jgi:hypothetical protein
MAPVGYSSVADQANTTDGYAQGVGAKNVPVTDNFGENVGDGGVVDLFHNSTPVSKFYILDETTPGYVLQEDSSKIVLEQS